MKKKWNHFKGSLTDVTMMSRREFWLTIAVCILGGMVFGLLFSPRKSVMIASGNGNCNNGNDNQGGKDCINTKKDKTADKNEADENKEDENKAE